MSDIEHFPPLTFDEPDPERAAKEKALYAMSKEELLALYKRTRSAATEARHAHDMEALYALVRGTKTIQRIAGERGMIIRAKRLLEP
jgi:hypothetical protein